MVVKRAGRAIWVATLCLAAVARAGEQLPPDRLISTMSTQVLDAVRGDSSLRGGDLRRVMELVDREVMPNVDMTRLTALAMGRHWRAATPEQQARLQAEFKTLIVRSYSGALSQVSPEQTVETRPLRSTATDNEVVVSTAIRGRGEPVRIDYRLWRTDGGWKIYDVAMLGVWLAENYRGSFAQEIDAAGIDGLIAKLEARNRTASAASESSKRAEK